MTFVDKLAQEIAQEGEFSRAITLPAIPAVGQDLASMARVIEALKKRLEVREGLGSQLDRAVTLRDLLDAGAIQLNLAGRVIGGSKSDSLSFAGAGTPGPKGDPGEQGPPGAPGGGFADPRPILETPPALGDFRVTGGFNSVFVDWTMVEYQNHRYVEVYRATTNSRGAAVFIGTTTTNFYNDTTAALGQLYFYWARAVGIKADGSTIFGPDNAVSGTSGGRLFVNGVDLAPLLIDASKLADGSVSASKLAAGAVGLTSFSSGIEPVTIVTGPLPTSKSTSTIFLTSDGKLYRWNGSAYVASVPSTDLTGTIDPARLADGSIAGTKFASGIEPITVVTGAIPTVKSTNTIFRTDDGKLYRWNGSAYVATVLAGDVGAGLTSAQIADLDAAKLTGTLNMARIANGSLDLTKFASTIQPITIVSSVPGTKSTETIFNTTDGKLYRWTGSAYVATVPAADISGQLSDSQLAAIAAAKITGQLATSQIADAAITTAKFASGLRPIEIVASLPSTGNFEGRMAFLTGDDKLYRHNGSNWVSSVPSTDITGQLTDAQLAAISAAKLTGQIVSTQITDGAITTPKVSAGAITANEIAAGAVTTAKVAAGAITAGEIAAGAVTTAKLSAGAVTANELAANSVISGKVQAGAISTAELAASAVTAAKIATGTITANEIAGATITGAKIAASTITGGNIAADTIAANNIAAGAITTAKLAAGAVTANELAANSVVAGKIQAGAIGATEIAAGSITASRLVVADMTNMVSDPMMQDNASWVNLAGTPWTVWGNSAVEDPAFRSTRFFKFQAAAGQYSGFVYTKWMPVEAGKVYTISAQGRSVGGVTDGAGMNLEWADDEARTNFTETNFTYVSANVATTTTITVTAPARKFLRVRFFKNNTSNTEAHWGGVSVRRRVDSALIVDGTITTLQIQSGGVNADRLVAGSITTDRMSANSINGDRILANSLAADKLVANSITAGQIASGTITTTQIQAGGVNADRLAAGTITTNLMAANTINGDRILAGSLDAAKITANSITAGQIAAGAIGASQITAGAIRAQHLLISPKGLNLDPTFAAGSTGWGGFVRRLASSNAAVPAGCPVSIASEFSLRDNASQTAIDVVPGEVYRASCWVNRGTGSAGQLLGIYGGVRNAAGGTVASFAWPGATTAANGWVRVTGLYTIPPNAAEMIFGPWADRPTYTGEAWYADLQVEKVADASLIVDGAVTADKIQAGAVVAGKLAANAVAANNIIAGTITGDRLAAGTITADRIQAGTITGDRIAGTTITASNIAAGAITANEIASNTLSTNNALTRNLTVRDGSGNVILSSGQPLQPANASNSLRNDQITVADGVLVGIGTNNVQVDNRYSNFLPRLTWDFSGSANGFSASGATISTGVTSITLSSSGSDPILRTPSGLGLDGAQFDKIRIRMRRIAGSGWDGAVFYSTSASSNPTHGELSTYFKSIPSTVTSSFSIIELDMSSLTDGGTDWIVSTISQIRFDFGATAADQFEVDWISVGRHAPALSQSDYLNSQITIDSQTGQISGIGSGSGSAVDNSVIRNNRNLIPPFTRWPIMGGNSFVTEIRSADGFALSIPGGNNLSAAHSPLLTLPTSSNQFTVSFVAFVSSGTRGMSVDLFPDTLPQSNFTITTTPTLYKFTWTVNHPDAASCALRFFSTTTGGDAYIYSVQLEYGSQYTPWSPEAFSVTSAWNPISTSNITTFISGAAIGTAQIGNAAIGTAQIGDAQITTAKIADLQVSSAKIADLTITTGKIGNDQIVTEKLAAEAAVVTRITTRESVTQVSSGSTTFNGASQTFDAATITYNTKWYGSRRIDLEGWAGTTGGSHISGSTGGYEFQWQLVRLINGSGSTVIWAGPVVTGSGSTPPVSPIANVVPSLLFDTGVPAGQTAGTTASVTYKLVLRCRSNGVSVMTVNLPAVTYASERYISVVEFNRGSVA